jgi:hypothetical protein
MEGYRNKASNGKIYTLRRSGKIVFVGRVSQIADRFNFDPAQIYDSIKRYGTFLGMEVTEAKPTDKVPTYVESRTYEPKRYKDASSVRFTPL